MADKSSRLPLLWHYFFCRLLILFQAVPDADAKPLVDDYVTLKAKGLALDEVALFANKPTLPVRAFNYRFKLEEVPLVGRF